MTKRMILPLLFGLVGAMILVSLGLWQVQRLAWKEGVLAEIEARIVGTPVSVPGAPDPARDQYLPVTATGTVDGPALRVLVSRKLYGAGYRIISPLTIGSRRVMVDRGFVEIDKAPPGDPAGPVTVTGNLLWPDDKNSSTPAPDIAGNIWFARDLPAMADVLGTEPVLIVARQTSFSDAPITPLPIDTSGIPNDHLSYAITWFSLAVVWLGMTALLVWRIRQRTE